MFLKSCGQLSESGQKLDVILVIKVVAKFKLLTTVNIKKCALKMILINEKKIRKIQLFLTQKIDFENQNFGTFDYFYSAERKTFQLAGCWVCT